MEPVEAAGSPTSGSQPDRPPDRPRLVCLQNAGQSSQGSPTPHGPATPWRAKERVEGHLAQETSEPSHPIQSGEPQTPGLISGCGDRLKLSELFIKSVPGAALTPWLPRPH